MATEIRCFQCGDELTPEDDGMAINGGEFYQCDVCHFNEFGYHIYGDLLLFKSALNTFKFKDGSSVNYVKPNLKIEIDKNL
jgi:hypothetical protein